MGMPSEGREYAERTYEKEVRDQSEVEGLVARLEEQCESLSKVLGLHAQRIAAYTRNEVRQDGTTVAEVARVAQTGMGQRLDQVVGQLRRCVAEVADLTSLFEG